MNFIGHYSFYPNVLQNTQNKLKKENKKAKKDNYIDYSAWHQSYGLYQIFDVF